MARQHQRWAAGGRAGTWRCLPCGSRAEPSAGAELSPPNPQQPQILGVAAPRHSHPHLCHAHSSLPANTPGPSQDPRRSCVRLSLGAAASSSCSGLRQGCRGAGAAARGEVPCHVPISSALRPQVGCARGGPGRAAASQTVQVTAWCRRGSGTCLQEAAAQAGCSRGAPRCPDKRARLRQAGCGCGPITAPAPDLLLILPAPSCSARALPTPFSARCICKTHEDLGWLHTRGWCLLHAAHPVLQRSGTGGTSQRGGQRCQRPCKHRNDLV